MFIITDLQNTLKAPAWVSRSGREFKWTNGAVANSPKDGVEHPVLQERLREVVDNEIDPPANRAAYREMYGAPYVSGDDWVRDVTFVAKPAPPPPLTEEEKTAAWMDSNPEAVALILGLNRPVDDPLHIPVNTGLAKADLVKKIVDNKE